MGVGTGRTKGRERAGQERAGREGTGRTKADDVLMAISVGVGVT